MDSATQRLDLGNVGPGCPSQHARGSYPTDAKKLLEACQVTAAEDKPRGTSRLAVVLSLAAQLYSATQAPSMHEQADTLVEVAAALWLAVDTCLAPCEHCSPHRSPSCACCLPDSSSWSQPYVTQHPSSSRHQPVTVSHAVTRAMVHVAMACWELHQHLQGAYSSADVATPRSSAGATSRDSSASGAFGAALAAEAGAQARAPGSDAPPPPGAPDELQGSWALFVRALAGGRGMAMMCALQSGCMCALGKTDAPPVEFSRALDLAHTADAIHPLELGVRLQHMCHNVALEVCQREGCAQVVVGGGQRAQVAAWLCSLSSHWVLTLVSLQSFTTGTVMAQWPATARDPLLLPHQSQLTLCEHINRLLRMLRVWWRVCKTLRQTHPPHPAATATLLPAVVCGLCYALPVTMGGSAWEQVGLVNQWLPEYVGLGGAGFPMPALPAALRQQAAQRPRRGSGAAHLQCSALAVDVLVELLGTETALSDGGGASAAAAGGGDAPSPIRTLLPVLRCLPGALDKLDVRGIRMTNELGIRHLPAAAALVGSCVLYAARLPQHEATVRAFCASMMPGAASSAAMLTAMCATVSGWLQPALSAVRHSSSSAGGAGGAEVPRSLHLLQPGAADLGLSDAAAVTVAAHLLSAAPLSRALPWLVQAAGSGRSSLGGAEFGLPSWGGGDTLGLASAVEGMSSPLVALQLAWCARGGVQSVIAGGVEPPLAYMLEQAAGLGHGTGRSSAPQLPTTLVLDPPSPGGVAGSGGGLLRPTLSRSPSSVLQAGTSLVSPDTSPSFDAAPTLSKAVSWSRGQLVSAVTAAAASVAAMALAAAPSPQPEATTPPSKTAPASPSLSPEEAVPTSPLTTAVAKAAAASALAAAAQAPIKLCQSVRTRSPERSLLPARNALSDVARKAEEAEHARTAVPAPEPTAAPRAASAGARSAEVAAIGADAEAAAAAAAAAMASVLPLLGRKPSVGIHSGPLSGEGARRATASDGLASGGSTAAPTSTGSGKVPLLLPATSTPHARRQDASRSAGGGAARRGGAAKQGAHAAPVVPPGAAQSARSAPNSGVRGAPDHNTMLPYNAAAMPDSRKGVKPAQTMPNLLHAGSLNERLVQAMAAPAYPPLPLPQHQHPTNTSLAGLQLAQLSGVLGQSMHAQLPQAAPALAGLRSASLPHQLGPAVLAGVQQLLHPQQHPQQPQLDLQSMIDDWQLWLHAAAAAGSLDTRALSSQLSQAQPGPVQAQQWAAAAAAAVTGGGRALPGMPSRPAAAAPAPPYLPGWLPGGDR